jgi:hypothetical protein
MPMRLKKLIGLVLLLLLILIYSLLVLRLAIDVLPGAGGFVEFLFYAIAGLAWVLPAGFLIKWMNRPGRGEVA